MDLAPHAQLPERRPSPGLTIELSSNNPFRNRAASPLSHSPGLESPRSTHSAPSNRPVSRNPFLANFEQENNQFATHFANRSASTLITMEPAKNEAPRKQSFADELLRELSLDDSNRPDDRRPPPPYRTVPPPGSHRPSQSQHEPGPGSRSRPHPRGPPREDRDRDRGERSERSERRHESPRRSEGRRARRNSDSSLMDKGSLTEDERRRKERKEREKARGDRPSREGRPSKSSKRPGYIDVIDKMDVTGLYGSGLFHHDGPYDSLNPHRNRKKDTRAPMQAFPANSANNALGGSGPVNKNIDLERIHGLGAEGFTDFNATRGQEGYEYKKPSSDRQVSFDPKMRIEQMHGEESAGLGTSTFLEGAPASHKDIARQRSENEQAMLNGGGLGRKKSLAQRIRGISQPRRFDAPRINSPEARYGGSRSNGLGSPELSAPLTSSQAQSAGGISKSSELNPFFNDYDEAYEKKGTTIKIAEQQRPTRARAPSSPGLRLERRVTTESFDEQPKASSGFLSRVKSLKGGKRRPERPGP